MRVPPEVDLVVNKEFYMIWLRRRQELMRAQATASSHSANFGNSHAHKKPLSNPFVNPRQLLDSMIRAEGEPPLPSAPTICITCITQLVMENRDLFGCRMTTWRIHVIFLADDGKASAAWVKDETGFDSDDDSDDHFELRVGPRTIYQIKDFNLLSPDCNGLWD